MTTKQKPANVEIFELTAAEAAGQDDELIWQYSKRPEFRLCFMNAKIREQMLEVIVRENRINGGWFWWYCMPGCLPDSSTFGPFESYQEALQDAMDTNEDADE